MDFRIVGGPFCVLFLKGWWVPFKDTLSFDAGAYSKSVRFVHRWFQIGVYFALYTPAPAPKVEEGQETPPGVS